MQYGLAEGKSVLTMCAAPLHANLGGGPSTSPDGQRSVIAGLVLKDKRFWRTTHVRWAFRGEGPE